MNPLQGTTKITLYWLEHSRAQRIAWLLSELHLDYDIRVFKRTASGTAPKELRDIHPLGKSPVVSVHAEGAEKPIVLAESGAIVEYLCEHFGRELVPRRYREGEEGMVGGETEEWLKYSYLMHYAEGSLMLPLVISFILSKIENAPLPFFIKPLLRMITNKINTTYIDRELRTHMQFLESYLSGDFLCGEKLTAADVQMLFPLEGAYKRVPLTEETYPKLHKYVRNMQMREAYKQAAEKVSRASGETYVAFSDSRN
ncbi:glutathione transferase [Sporormia fimetaria CBS 119925]|uniref:Glutathione transferase n=1 Tax=Sporormia fimetaria CBS 119925 TaxID=1340428 RepID=A0A6A6V7V3_9PLEO|nr:glutathione transferase [Sporormia fimetaria CBS 119925]